MSSYILFARDWQSIISLEFKTCGRSISDHKIAKEAAKRWSIMKKNKTEIYLHYTALAKAKKLAKTKSITKTGLQ